MTDKETYEMLDARVDLLNREIGRLRRERNAALEHNRELIKVGTHEIDHLFNGACPDVGGHDYRDPDCPACKVLTGVA